MDISYDEEEELTRRRLDQEDEKPKKESSNTVEISMYAGFWMRLWAYAVDWILVVALNALLISPIFMFLDASPELFGIITIHSILTSVVAYVYFAIMTKLTGQTLGKMIFGIRVLRADGYQLTWGDTFFREVAGRILHRTLVITNVMYIVVGVHPQKAGVHDLLADTRVILDRRKKSVMEGE
ncbi:putative RDD family membrane protein YckC [Geomicrobium halophilum]|uniref:Putative RDD family membrane protein YckC n=1 Tax=Geomicrobium halophilum TaxID=549000 RepID=A0A841PH85_9BACL|nr:RDD family protein [Geomicrobium halophilum]MBB6448150.1 putative RDD family membrane protein YckC [Geomicrobium halophilum]